jgi:hypothetical protein
MNAQTIYELFLDGAYHKGNQLFHPSFKKGYRTVWSSNISLLGAIRMLTINDKYHDEDGVIKAE